VKLAHDREPERAGGLAKETPDLTYFTRALQTLLLQSGYMREGPCLFSFSQRGSPRVPLSAGAAPGGHAGHLGSLPARLAGRPAFAAQTPTLGGGSGAAELAGSVAMTSCHARRWRGRFGHPSPPRSQPTSARASKTYLGLGRSAR
jgi:hypothetical protein